MAVSKTSLRLESLEEVVELQRWSLRYRDGLRGMQLREMPACRGKEEAEEMGKWFCLAGSNNGRRYVGVEPVLIFEKSEYEGREK